MNTQNNILGHGIYTPAQAARLLGSNSINVLRWTRGSGPNQPLWNGHYQFLEDSNEISFFDLVELRVVTAFRRAGSSMQSIRFAIEFAQQKLGIERPLSSQQFKTDGTEILMEAAENDGDFISLSRRRPGQKVFREIISQSLNDLEYENNSVARWRPKNFSSVVIDPKRHFGAPILDKHGLSTSILREEFEEFEDLDYLSSIYEVPKKSISDAIKFETNLDNLSD